MQEEHLRKQILYYAIKYKGEYSKIKKAIEDDEDYEVIDYDGNYITIIDQNYPKSLFKLNNPPYILFYEGNLALFDDLGVAVIGSRIVSDYGVAMCQKVTRRLKKKYVIISGLAKGIDGIAHQEALNAKSIGILGCGIDIAYPSSNYSLIQTMKAKHLVISEYPKGVLPLKHHFPARNRLIAALSKALIVIEAKKQSGTMITVNEALTLNIPIYCIPHNINHSYGLGCNLLIQQGANMLVDEYDIDSI